MSIIDRLPSQTGTRAKDGTIQAAQRCLAEPQLLAEIVHGLGGKNARLAGDCAEVMTKVAEQQPDVVAPHAETLLASLAHRNGRVRWESAHALALISSKVPRTIHGALPRLGDIVRRDESVIVCDYALDAIAGYGSTSPRRPRRCSPSSARDSTCAARSTRPACYKD